MCLLITFSNCYFFFCFFKEHVLKPINQIDPRKIKIKIKLENSSILKLLYEIKPMTHQSTNS